jgi:CubicO group peptidase (beta-lactamase class C family)
MSALKKTGIILIVLIPLIIFLVLVWAFVSYPAEYVVRGLRWRIPEVTDYQKFPARDMMASSEPFLFDEALDEARVQALFERDPAIDDLEAFLADNDTQAFIVIQDDAILYERYFNDTERDSIVTSFSTAKSFGSALIGIAIAEGHINSVNDPITDYLPELIERDEGFADISIRDLLLMSSGIKYREMLFLNGDDAKTYYYPDLRQLALQETKIVDPPGDYFLYNNYHPLLLGMILERATGMAVADYLESRIWQPMGAEFDGSWSLDSEETQFEKMESGINGRTIDFAKFGRLYLNEGNWDGRQVVPAEWVKESTQPDPALDEGSYFPDYFDEFADGGYYKYLWWGVERDVGEHDFSALGNNGQFIYVSPQNDLIVVRNAQKYGPKALDWLEIFHNFASEVQGEG